MHHLPRPIADWLALWRDLPRHPRQVLLNRAHFTGSTIAICLGLVLDMFHVHPHTTEALYLLFVVAGPSSLVAMTGGVAHVAWAQGWIWSDLRCECCDPGPDDDEDDDEPEPDEPDDPSGIARDAEAWLRAHTLTHA